MNYRSVNQGVTMRHPALKLGLLIWAFTFVFGVIIGLLLGRVL